MGMAWAYVLLWRGPLDQRTLWPWLLILLHSFLIVKNLRGTPSMQRHGYLYSRGLSRDVLWTHLMLGHIVAVLVAHATALRLFHDHRRAARLATCLKSRKGIEVLPSPTNIIYFDVPGGGPEAQVIVEAEE